MLQSYWYGAGLILGERMMYTFHWEKINTRIKKGEDFLSVLESEMNPAITAIANYSLTIMKKTGAIYMQGGIDFMAKLIENMFKLVAGENIEGTVDEGELVDPLDEQCGVGMHWDKNSLQCVPDVSPDDDFKPPPEPEPTPTPEPSPTQITNTDIINASFGKTRSGLSNGVRVWTLWTRKNHELPGTDAFNWSRINSVKYTTKSSIITAGHIFWPLKQYAVFTFGTGDNEQSYFVLRSRIGLPDK